LARSPVPEQEAALAESDDGDEESPVAEVEERKAEEEPEPVSIAEDKDEQLDPPMGIGLRFDEIEEMIDEVLSLDDS